ncbi:hypothetical protein SLEP1_g40443 [Rubroshorea leprosula]|uniref:Uncharacterized protein n=1 Tax=Rubroshorea leprosula TaxID=152421 RepID=A0AAV5L3G6_9ROSI|nr:hypothetical protein SLEP1_g40443 [Rubroshorea leprosula]
MNSMRMQILPIVSFVFFALLQLSYGQVIGSSPAPGPVSNGAAIDQGIAYLLLILALAIAYIFH